MKSVLSVSSALSVFHKSYIDGKNVTDYMFYKISVISVIRIIRVSIKI